MKNQNESPVETQELRELNLNSPSSPTKIESPTLLDVEPLTPE